MKKSKKCKVCQKEFTPFNSLQKVCSSNCAIQLTKEQKKIKEEFYYSYKNTHIFKIKVKKTKKWALWFQDKKIRDVEYLGYCESGIFTPSNITWKELIKENEKRSS